METTRNTITKLIVMVLVGAYPGSYSFAASEDGTGNENGNGAPARATNAVDWVNAVAMGADDTGEKDCSELVQELLNAYSTVYFPKGNYRFDKGLVVGSHKTILG
jgi:hypothetical protein